MLLAAVLAGVVLRCEGLDRRPLWYDEAATVRDRVCMVFPSPSLLAATRASVGAERTLVQLGGRATLFAVAGCGS